MNTPYDTINFRTYRVVWQFRENQFRDVEKYVSEKKIKKINSKSKI